jgi:hypothetical protein
VSEYTVEEAVRIYTEWDDLKDFLYDQLCEAGYGPNYTTIRVEANQMVFEDHHEWDYRVPLAELLTSTGDELKNLKLRLDAEEKARVEAKNAAFLRQHEERRLAEARALIARYDGRHPNEDIES